MSYRIIRPQSGLGDTIALSADTARIVARVFSRLHGNVRVLGPEGQTWTAAEFEAYCVKGGGRK